MNPATGLRLRRGPLWSEVGVLVLVQAAEIVLEFSVGTVISVTPALITVTVLEAGVGVLALLRRRFPAHLPLIASAAIALTLLCLAVGALAGPPQLTPGAVSTLGLSLLTGACCHRLSARAAGLFTVLSGLCVVLIPLLVYGSGVAAITLAFFVGVIWVGGVAVGLILRDAATRNAAALELARTGERLALARELHDLVAHHITGVVVRAQAANLVLSDRPENSGAAERELLTEIEQAGTSALGAMRRLVSMLRDSASAPLAEPYGTLRDAVSAAVGENPAVTVSLAEELAELATPPELVSTAHRVVLESLTNVRKHAPTAREIEVRIGLTVARGTSWVRIQIRNDGVHQGRPGLRTEYGLVGMRERVSALGGELEAGRSGDRSWQVVALLPVPLPETGLSTRVSEESSR